jgi:hypothetical protein
MLKSTDFLVMYRSMFLYVKWICLHSCRKTFQQVSHIKMFLLGSKICNMIRVKVHNLQDQRLGIFILYQLEEESEIMTIIYFFSKINQN